MKIKSVEELTPLELAIVESLSEATNDKQSVYKNTKRLYKLIREDRQIILAQLEEVVKGKKRKIIKPPQGTPLIMKNVRWVKGYNDAITDLLADIRLMLK